MLDNSSQRSRSHRCHQVLWVGKIRALRRLSFRGCIILLEMIAIEDNIPLFYNSEHKSHLRANEINKLQGDHNDDMY